MPTRNPTRLEVAMLANAFALLAYRLLHGPLFS